MIAVNNVIALTFCGYLWLRGKVAPQSNEVKLTSYFPQTIFQVLKPGWIVSEYFWGLELYPRFLGVDVKQLVACRCSLVAWALLPIGLPLPRLSQLFPGQPRIPGQRRVADNLSGKNVLVGGRLSARY